MVQVEDVFEVGGVHERHFEMVELVGPRGVWCCYVCVVGHTQSKREEKMGEQRQRRTYRIQKKRPRLTDAHCGARWLHSGYTHCCYFFAEIWWVRR